jgi:hypothetical protein
VDRRSVLAAGAFVCWAGFVASAACRFWWAAAGLAAAAVILMRLRRRWPLTAMRIFRRQIAEYSATGQIEAKARRLWKVYHPRPELPAPDEENSDG